MKHGVRGNHDQEILQEGVDAGGDAPINLPPIPRSTYQGTWSMLMQTYVFTPSLSHAANNVIDNKTSHAAATPQALMPVCAPATHVACTTNGKGGRGEGEGGKEVGVIEGGWRKEGKETAGAQQTLEMLARAGNGGAAASGDNASAPPAPTLPATQPAAAGPQPAAAPAAAGPAVAVAAAATVAIAPAAAEKVGSVRGGGTASAAPAPYFLPCARAAFVAEVLQRVKPFLQGGPLSGQQQQQQQQEKQCDHQQQPQKQPQKQQDPHNLLQTVSRMGAWEQRLVSYVTCLEVSTYQKSFLLSLSPSLSFSDRKSVV